VDAICDGEDILIPGIMEHLERAGVHSGDSITIYPSQTITEEIQKKIVDYTKNIALALKVKGMVNIQFILQGEELYIIEVNPRSSRTVPYISKVTELPVVELATKVMMGERIKDLGYSTEVYQKSAYVAVKVPVFSTEKLPLAEMSLGPEMKSTGEVLGVGKTLESALYKGFVAAGMKIPKAGATVLVTLKDQDKAEFLPMAKDFVERGINLMATAGTAKFLKQHRLPVEAVRKINEETPNILDIIRSGKIDLIINTPTKGKEPIRDGFKIRRTALESSVKVLTSLDTVGALLKVMKYDLGEDELDVINLGVCS